MNHHGSTSEAQPMRQEILTTARNLFIQQGYRGLSMSTLARAVGVSKAALYYHFKDKEELFLAILKQLLDGLEFMINQVKADSDDSRQRIQSLVDRILAWSPDQRAAIRLASQELPQISHQASQSFNLLYHEKFIGKIQDIIETGIHRGELRAVDPPTAAWALLGIMYPFLNQNQPPENPSSNIIAKHLTLIYLNGLEQKPHDDR